MTTEEAIKNLDDGDWRDYLDDYIPEEIRNKLVEAIDIADAALHAQQERENPKPLTLEELREMNGEPVWLHTFSSVQKKTNISQWAILETVGNANAVFLRAGCNTRLTKWFSNYGKTWLAYRNRPHTGRPTA